ncbi:hypothetical protein BKA66DRAFT_474670 [Pyrenochaeta sp. MPI-SDFR-AT-0127]|nr:hypothetical protein BKA66DRAFT_474670 [Pyrenochaeta sp. MPI-SDFR-AT-0127]
MAPATSLPRLSRLSVFSLFVFAIPFTHAASIFPRQASTCGGIANLQQCGTSFPSSFCCPKDTTCMSLNSASVQSVICCPSGSDCAFIQPITCDATQLNATLHPDNQMHLSETNGVELPRCGEKCCPLGYTCKSGMCSKDLPSPSPTSTAGSTASATNPASASQTSNCPAAAPIQTSQGFDGRSFAAGFFPGIVIGALGTIGLIWVINKRRESQTKERYSGDFGHVARQISDPIYDPEHAARTDFIRRGSQSAQPSPNSTDKIVRGMKGTGNGGGGITPRIKSMWDRTPKLNFGFTTGLPSNPAPLPPAVRATGNSNIDPYTTPPPKHAPRRKHSKQSSHRHSHGRSHRPQPTRSGSQETIDVLMPAPSFLEPPRALGMRENRLTTDSSNTTFTKLMERAGFDDDGRQEVRNWKVPGQK